jgi:hypothetical protein
MPCPHPPAACLRARAHLCILFLLEPKRMKLSQPLILKLSRKYEPGAFVEMRYRGKDLAFKTDKEGDPVVLFIGKLTDGRIKGERYVRTLIRDDQGSLSKDHWDLKGRST